MAKLSTSDGIPTGHVFSFLRKLIPFVKDVKPDLIAVAIDSGYKHRTELYPDYKSTRDKKESSVRVKDVYPIITSIPVLIARKKNYEADDIIYSLVRKLEKKKLWSEIIVLSKDYDMSYVLTRYPKIKHYLTTTQEITPAGVYLKFGVHPAHLPLYKAVFGDVSDNIKGLKLGRMRSVVMQRFAEDFSPDKIIKGLSRKHISKIINNLKVVKLCNVSNIKISIGKSSKERLAGFLHSKEINSISPEDILGNIPNNPKLIKETIRVLREGDRVGS
jgi:5'-3' exonuclease